MKIFAVILTAIIMLFTQCKKDEDLLRNKTWLLVDGQVYIEELDSGSKTYYDHFDSGKESSSLNLDGGITETDSITRNKTTWFFGKSTFTLNNTTSFDCSSNGNIIRVYGLRNGSAMIVQIKSVSKSNLTVMVGETVESIKGKNVSYFSILKFIKQ